jgi:copper chaperone CopZ
MNKPFFLTFAMIMMVGLFFSVDNVAAQSANAEETKITVLGNCGMCKDRIERAARSVRGVSNATWNQKEKVLTVSYRTDRTNQEAIERAVAKAGHDTENFITDEKTWANLHHCCKYTRDPQMLGNNKLWNKE